jgi:hypothetical protein
VADLEPAAVRRLLPALAVVLVVLVAAPPAAASQLIDRNAKYVKFAVNRRGVAALDYWAGGRHKHVLVWGAINAVRPDRDHPRSQREFRLNYAGGYRSRWGARYWRRVFRGDVCRRYTGPPLALDRITCTMPDGSHWAVQRFQRLLPNLGRRPKRAGQRAREMHVSHWKGALPKLWLKGHWAYAGAAGGPFDAFYGRFTYKGNPVYGFSSTDAGAPTDSFGRLVFLDTHDPPWRRGYRQRDDWWRQNSFLTHRANGNFCVGVYATVGGTKRRDRAGRGDYYRAFASGPGVTPIVKWRGPPPGYYRPGLDHLRPTRDRRGPYRRALDRALAADQRATSSGRGDSCYTAR